VFEQIAKPTQSKLDARPISRESAPSQVTELALDGATILRKASCACGGGCPSCQSKSSDMKISQPTDAAEIEADQIADRVMRMPAGDVRSATSPSNGGNTIYRKCDACDDDDAKTVQRKALPSTDGPTANSPGHVQNAISSGGQPLDAETRSFFEPRIGYDLSSVRVHTDGHAHESADAIKAKAYTLGDHIVFGRGQYRPDADAGKRLLAHELAHTTQRSSGAQRVIHRDGEAIEFDPVIEEYWEMEGLRGSEEDQANLNALGTSRAMVGYRDLSGRAISPQEICSDQGKGTNWSACSDIRESQANARLMQSVQKEQAEIPQIFLMRGGDAADAFIKTGMTKTDTFSSGTVLTYTPRFFHIIDAMEHDFNLSTSHVGDQILFNLYFPELQQLKIAKASKADIEFLRRTAIGRVTFTPDPQTLPERLKALVLILDTRKAKIAALAKRKREEKVRTEAETAALTSQGKQRLEGACSSKLVPRKGGHARHDRYAEHVAQEKNFGKVKKELEYTTPEGVSYSFDVYNPANKAQVIEVKTMHDWAGPDKIAIAPRVVRSRKTKLPNLSDRIAALESQRLKGIYVAMRCGLTFSYAFDNCEAYRGFKEQWILPPLEYIPYPGETKEVCND